MLSYQHGYHAGAFADVFKHLALTRLLSYLIKKDKPLFYLETHSGKGIYDLLDKQALKTGESKQGIELLWPTKNSLPPIFTDYIQTIEALNKNGKLRYYPGSPYFAIQLLRSMDRLYLSELHPKEFEALECIPRLYKKVQFNNADGMASLKALLPPLEKRALIFIDPSYELKDEYKHIPIYIKQAYTHFSNGVYCLWYPLVNKRHTEQLLRNMKAIGAKNTLRVEFYLTTKPQVGMTGCGLWIINPTFEFAQEIKVGLELLKTYFNPGQSSYLIE
ncbi:MAG: 23S rRNA (adenine(2030)-N(6))-methyltransferase RlmJ [Legionella sp.]|nr:23S rRNA (adenine(2030)-N(6))-methyltransferase RlmJ [Legionella sp.]